MNDVIEAAVQATSATGWLILGYLGAALAYIMKGQQW